MKIFVIRNGWIHKDFGGAELLAMNLVQGLNSLGHQATLIAGSEAMLARCKEQRVNYIQGPYSTRQILTKHRFVFIPTYLLGLRVAYRSYLKIFKENRPELIHTHGQQEHIAATAAANKLGIPIVWSDHGELKGSLKKSFLPPWGIPGMLVKRNMRRISSLCMVNPDDIEAVRRVNNNVPITIIPNGVPAHAIKPRKSYDLVFASRVIREKGIFELLNAYKQLVEKKPEATLLIAGGGPSLHQAELFVSENSLSNITFENYTDEAITKAKVFVLPTYTEAQSLTIIKAMMYKTPVLTTSVDGNTHFLEHKHTAYLVVPKDQQSLYDGIIDLLENKTLRNNISQKAHVQFLQQHDLEIIIKEHYLPLFTSVIQS